MKIPASHGRLEARLRPAEGPVRGGAVVCHPHPLHGGSMHTKAVFRTGQALAEVGFHVLRFNFRGVGASTGSHDEGRGERDDARDALDWLEERHPGLPLLLGGFSFGSRVALSLGVEEDRVRGLLGLGLPLEMYDYRFLEGAGKPLLLIQGERDRFGGGDRVRELVERLGGDVHLVVVPGSDHFFDGHEEALKSAVREYFESGEGGRSFPPIPGP